MKKILILTVALSLLPVAAPAQQRGSETIRQELEQVRQVKDQTMESISLEASLMKSAVRPSGSRPRASHPAPLQPLVHPAPVGLPGRTVISVLLPPRALPNPVDLPAAPARPIPAMTTVTVKTDPVPLSTTSMDPVDGLGAANSP